MNKKQLGERPTDDNESFPGTGDSDVNLMLVGDYSERFVAPISQPPSAAPRLPSINEFDRLRTDSRQNHVVPFRTCSAVQCNYIIIDLGMASWNLASFESKLFITQHS